MTKKIKILSLDIGNYFGVAVSLDGEIAFTEEFKFKSFKQIECKLKDYIRLWKPDIILAPYPTRFYNTIMKHSKMLGVICLTAEKFELPLIEVQDATCKKAVIGTGKAKKEDIEKFYKHLNINSEHILDSIMFIDWYLKAIEE